MLWKITATLIWAKVLDTMPKPMRIEDVIKVCIPVEAHNFDEAREKAKQLFYETFGTKSGYEGPGIKFELFEVVSF